MIISPCTVGVTEICSHLKALIMLRHDFKMAKLSDFKQFYVSFIAGKNLKNSSF
jgi:hypothetical protein